MCIRDSGGRKSRQSCGAPQEDQSEMRIIAGALALVAVTGLAHANNENGEYCAIPKLEQGVATTVEVPYIDKPFCGTALIDKHYVRMAEFLSLIHI